MNKQTVPERFLCTHCDLLHCTLRLGFWLHHGWDISSKRLFYLAITYFADKDNNKPEALTILLLHRSCYPQQFAFLNSQLLVSPAEWMICCKYLGLYCKAQQGTKWSCHVASHHISMNVLNFATISKMNTMKTGTVFAFRWKSVGLLYFLTTKHIVLERKSGKWFLPGLRLKRSIILHWHMQ